MAIKFNNINEIKKYYSEQLKKGNTRAINDFKTKSDKKIGVISDDILVAEAKRLKNCIQKYIDMYYDILPPADITNRTGRLQKALRVDTSIRLIGNKRCIALYFNEADSWGESRVNKGVFSGYKPTLGDRGYKSNLFVRPHFKGYEGFRYVEKGIDEWRRGLQYPIDINPTGMMSAFYDYETNIVGYN